VTEEAIINALVAAETMVGRDGNRSEALTFAVQYEQAARPTPRPSRICCHLKA